MEISIASEIKELMIIDIEIWFNSFDMIKKDLRSYMVTNQIYYMRAYTGKKWRVKNLATGEYTYLVIDKDDVYVTENNPGPDTEGSPSDSSE